MKTVPFSLFQDFWLTTFSLWLPPATFEIWESAVSISAAEKLCSWVEATSQYCTVCEVHTLWEKGEEEILQFIRGSSVIAVTVLFKKRQITAHCFMLPSSTAPLLEISSILHHFRKPACLCALTANWRRGPDGGLSAAACFLKLSSNITP